MVYHSLASNVLFYEGKGLFVIIYPLCCFLICQYLGAETSLHSFEMYPPTFHRRMVLRSKFAYEHIVCSMSRLQKISCGSTGVRKRWRRMHVCCRNGMLCVENG